MTAQNQKGFTLVEIIIVIAIIAALSVVTFGGLRYLQKAKESTTRTKLASLDAMIDQYNSQMQRYPTDLHELIEGPNEPALRKRWGEAIASESDLQDGWNQPFVYELLAKGSRPPYRLYSIGSSGNAQILSPRSQE